MIQSTADLLASALQAQQQGASQRAEASYREVLRREPEHVAALANLGSLLRREGRMQEALALLARAVEIAPKDAAILFNYGNALQHAGVLDEAERHFRAAIAVDPAMGAAHFNLGNLLRDTARPEEAIAAYTEATRRAPKLADAHRNLGNVLRQVGRPKDAAESHKRALAIDDRQAAFWLNLANAYADMTQYAEAAFACHEALRRQPDFTVARKRADEILAFIGNKPDGEKVLTQLLARASNFNAARCALGSLLFREKRYGDARDQFQLVLRLDGKDVDALNGMGVCLQLLKQGPASMQYFLAAVQHAPQAATAYCNLGMAHGRVNELEKATKYLKKALELSPDMALAHSNLGLVLSKVHRLEEAAMHARRAVELDPSLVDSYLNLGYTLQNTGDTDGSLAAFREALKRTPDSASAHSNALYTMSYSHRFTPEEVAAEHFRWGGALEAATPEATDFTNSADPEKRLRIGYFSADFRRHSVALFIEHFFDKRDRENFELVGFSNTSQRDEWTQSFIRNSNEWHELQGLEDEQMYQIMRDARVDIMVDLLGHTAENRLALFARRLAPVQVSYIGYPNTTGLRRIDWQMTDAWADPYGQHDHLFSEGLWRLPECYLCYRPQDLPDVSDLPAFKNGYVTFGSFNNLPKYTPEVVALWSRLVRETPGSRLMLKGSSFTDKLTRARFHTMFGEHGITEERLLLVDWDPHMHEIDIALDPFPYQGATTTCQALWMGLPVVSLLGPRHSQHVSASILRAGGLGDLCTRTPDEYIATAQRLAGDLPALAAIRKGMRERLKASPLMDGQRHARDVENAYRGMWRQWCARRQQG